MLRLLERALGRPLLVFGDLAAAAAAPTCSMLSPCRFHVVLDGLISFLCLKLLI
jgi:hypothetical protein